MRGWARVKNHRRREWMALWLIIFGSLLAYWARFYLPWGDYPRHDTRKGTDCFLAVRLPELPNEEVGKKGQQERLDQWLRALKEAGFKPMFLSEALGRLKRRQDLPQRAVVLIFSHSYRPTVEALGPILRRHAVPAVWLTDLDLLEQSDQRLVSPHARRQMRFSRRWDLGSFRTSTAAFTLEDPELWGSAVGEVKLLWSADAGSRALNRLENLPRLNILNLSLAWTGRQVVERLYAEVPLRDKSDLTVVKIFKDAYGLPVYDTTAQRLKRFKLEPSANRRSGWVSWLGSAGLQDARVDLDVGLLIGELWLSLRSELDPGHCVQVGFTEDRIVVKAERWGRERRLAVFFYAPRRRRHLRAWVELRGSVLRIDAGDGRVLRVGLGQPPQPGRGIIELLVYHKIRGVAQANSISMALTPLEARLQPVLLSGGR